MIERLKENLLKKAEFNLNEGDYFQAAVLVPIILKESGPEVMFEVRAGHLAWQPGEICFPGGKIERSDKNPRAAAVRECCEELGLKRRQIKILGELETVMSPIGVILYPQVGVITGLISPNPAEVAEVFSVPIEYLLQHEAKIGHMEMATRPAQDFPLKLLPEYETNWKKRKSYAVYFYSWQHHLIWGLTALVLRRFLAYWRLQENEKADQ